MSGVHEILGDVGGVAAEHQATAESAWQSMRLLVLELHDKRVEVTATLGMSFTRAKVLRRLAQTPDPMPMGELAVLLGTDAPYLSVMVDDLETRGLVAKSPQPTDRRVRLVAVTDAGRAAASRADELLKDPPSSLTALSEADLRVLAEVLARLVSASG